MSAALTERHDAQTMLNHQPAPHPLAKAAKRAEDRLKALVNLEDQVGRDVRSGTASPSAHSAWVASRETDR
jgi:hypothetical protein